MWCEGAQERNDCVWKRPYRRNPMHDVKGSRRRKEGREEVADKEDEEESG